MRALVLSVVLASSTVFAQTPARPATHDAHPHAATPYALAIARGAEAYHRHDYDVALTAFREAAGIDAQAATPALYIGYVMAVRGDAAGANTSFHEALTLATAAGDDQARARALTALAMAQEAQGHWDAARTAWQDAGNFADGHAEVAYPGTSRGRIIAIRRRDDMEQTYAPVRQRIADRLRANAAGQGAAGDAVATPPSH